MNMKLSKSVEGKVFRVNVDVANLAEQVRQRIPEKLLEAGDECFVRIISVHKHKASLGLYDTRAAATDDVLGERALELLAPPVTASTIAHIGLVYKEGGQGWVERESLVEVPRLRQRGGDLEEEDPDSASSREDSEGHLPEELRLEAVEQLHEEMVARGLDLSWTGAEKFMKAGCGADDLGGMRNGGKEMFNDLMEDAKGDPFNARERGILKDFMGARQPQRGLSADEQEDEDEGGRVFRRVGGEGRGGQRGAMDARALGLGVAGVGGVASSDDSSPGATRPFGGEVRTATKGGAAGLTPVRLGRRGGAAPRAAPPAGGRVGELVAMLPVTEVKEFMEYALEAAAEKIFGREPSRSERMWPEVTMEVWLEKHLQCSAATCRAAASREVSEMRLWMARSVANYEAPANKARVNAGPQSGPDAGGGHLAEILAAGGGSHQADPALLEAMRAAAADDSLVGGLEAVKRLFGEGKAAEAVAMLSELGGRPHLATILYRASDIKHVQGTSTIAGANNLVLLVGADRDLLEGHVAAAVRELLPPTGDARGVARLLARGKVAEISWENIFAAKTGASLMPTAAKAAKSQGGVDATEEPYIIFVRGMSLMMVGYAAAHPFDKGASVAFAMLMSEVARAVQGGLALASAIVAIIEPVLQELARQWDEVGRRTAVARPRVGTVSEEQKDRRQQLVRNHLLLGSGREAPSGGKGGTAGGGVEAKGAKGALSEEWGKEVMASLRKLQQGAHQKGPQQPPPKTGGQDHSPPQPGAGKESEAAAWSRIPGNAGKCFHFMTKGACNRGASCRFAAETPGHS